MSTTSLATSPHVDQLWKDRDMRRGDRCVLILSVGHGRVSIQAVDEHNNKIGPVTSVREDRFVKKFIFLWTVKKP